MLQVQCQGQLQARHPGHAAVQTRGVRVPDQPEHGQRLGRGQVHPGHHHAATGREHQHGVSNLKLFCSGRQVSDREGSQQANLEIV